MKKWIFLIFSFLLACQSSKTSAPATQSAEAPSWNHSMLHLKKSLSTIEPLLFDSHNYELPENQKILGEEIHRMAEEAKHLQHDPTLISRDPTVRFVATQFSQDLQRADESFELGKKNFARYQLEKITSYCVECHTRMEQGPEVVFGRTEKFVLQMSVSDQMEYHIAGRRFGRAFDVGLRSLSREKQDALSSWEAEKVGRLALQIAVQFREERFQAHKLTKIIEKNSGLPFSLKEQNRRWQKSLDRWLAEGKKAQSGGLDKARQLWGAKTSEVESMRMIPMLLRFVSHEPPANQLGEGLLLIGEAYEDLDSISQMALHENYFESCILQVPHTSWSKLCYQKLRDSVVLGYSGSSGTNIPIDVQMNLERLKKQAE